ncbi:MFS transporter [Burkholderia cepacia]|uniref:MFS transporter n=1 Tax=Burkholderia cepacia TaxID=292 RepID=UPI000759E02E|nr:MFS transporter [Burkholderia cepacia]KWC78459.1 MFS transporter [Burkholderia cepacia]
MRLPTARTRVLTLRHIRTDLLPWAIAFAVGIDYFDNTIFSFFTSYIAGGINASPDELVWSATAYASASVLGIVQQQWLIERIGFRLYLSGCLLLFAAGSLAASLCESSLQLAMARAFQGYFIGPMLGTCRILLQTCFAPQERAPATRIFLTMILLASALAPMIGGYLVAHFDWPALFTCSTVAGVALAPLSFMIVPHVGKRRPERRGATHLWPYLVFAFALGALQIVMQQVRFELISTSPLLLSMTVAGLLALGWFTWHQWHDPRPLVRLNALRESSYRVGIVLYAFYYFISNAIGYLTSRLLQGSLGYPVANAGRLVGLTSLASIAMAFAYFHFAKRVVRKKWLIVPGFLMAACIGLWIDRLPPDVSMPWLLPPLVMRGFLLMFIALPTASVAFQIFSNDEFTHGYRFKNIIKQLTYSLSTASMIILEQHRTAVHKTRLAEFASPFNSVFQNTLDTMTGTLERLGHSSGDARAIALAMLARVASEQANFMSLLDGFRVMVVLALLGAVIALVQRQIR